MSKEPIIVTLMCFSIISVLCHRGTPCRGCVQTAYTDLLLSCLVNYSSLSCPYHTDTRLLSKRLQSLCPDFWLRAPEYQIDKRRCYFWKRHKNITSTQTVEEQESIEILFLQHWGCVMWCIVRYINLPPTLCRSKQTLCLLFVVLPQQYFYLSCETAIQIDEVQQHDIFCTSITLRGWATWVKSQQTITFPDISSPHSDRWWILPDKAFIIAENRECTKISSLFFSPPSSASPVQIEMNSAARSRMGSALTVRREKRWFAAGYSLAIKNYISLLQGGHYGAVGRGAYQVETTVLCQLRFDSATVRETAMEMSYDGMPLKISSLLSFISEFSALRLSGPRCIKSPHVAGSAQYSPKETIWKDVAKM